MMIVTSIEVKVTLPIGRAIKICTCYSGKKLQKWITWKFLHSTVHHAVGQPVHTIPILHGPKAELLSHFCPAFVLEIEKWDKWLPLKGWGKISISFIISIRPLHKYIHNFSKRLRVSTGNIWVWCTSVQVLMFSFKLVATAVGMGEDGMGLVVVGASGMIFHLHLNCSAVFPDWEYSSWRWRASSVIFRRVWAACRNEAESR